MRHFDTMDNLTEQIAMSRQMIGATISQIDREEIGGTSQSRATISHRPSLSQEGSLVLGFMLQPNLPGWRRLRDRARPTNGSDRSFARSNLVR